MSSNFVPSLGVKCESIFDALRDSGMTGKLVGIAHLVDAFGEEDVETVTAVTDNDDIDDALAARARAVLERDDPDLLVLQLLSVDQTGHARGSYNDEYLEKIEATDRIIAGFFEWCERNGYMDDATFMITSDHGQGIGIGGHGHMSPSEVHVPCILWGEGVERTGPIEEPRSIMDVAPTIAYYLGAQPPRDSVGQVLGVVEDSETPKSLAVIVPAYNEVENLPETLRRMPRAQVADMKVIVVDDGSTDGTSEAARLGGADVVVRHERNWGLGAALRTGLETAREMDAPRRRLYRRRWRVPAVTDPRPPGPHRGRRRRLRPRLEIPGVAGRPDPHPAGRQLRLYGLPLRGVGARDNRRPDGLSRLLPPRPGEGRDHPRLQLRAGDDPRPAQKGNAHARSAHLVHAPHEGQLLHRPVLPVARAASDGEGDARPVTSETKSETKED